MENIDFVLWTVLYPLGCAITSYYASKERLVNGKDPFTFLSALINLFIWVIIANALYN